MLISAEKLLGYPILSLHAEGMVAKVSEIVVDPNDLKVVAFKAYGPQIGTSEVGEYLQTKRVREFSNIGMVIDSFDDFADRDDVVSLQKILKLNFSLDGMLVETKKGSKLGKVSGYMVNTNGFIVQQLIVQRPLMKSFLDPELLVGRSEVYKITDEKIIVKDEEAKIRAGLTKEDFVPNFVNPFRKPQLSTADNQSLDEQDN